jgi:inosose dehydratase
MLAECRNLPAGGVIRVCVNDGELKALVTARSLLRKTDWVSPVALLCICPDIWYKLFSAGAEFRRYLCQLIVERSDPATAKGNDMTQSSRPLSSRMAGAPISWGICEVPGWGLQLPVERVLSEMTDVGLVATELGAAGWLPTEAAQVNEVLGRHHLSAVAAFQPIVVHDADRLEATLQTADVAAQLLQDVGASNFVSCLVSDPNDWQRPELSDEQWQCVYRGLAEIDVICAAHGLTQVVHPHVDSLIETAEEVERVLAHTSAQFCLDTGHLFIGGTDPVEFATKHADRVGLVHLKDVRSNVVGRLLADELTLMEAVQEGIFAPLGEGDLALAEVVQAVEAAGYDGWYVFEQDAALTDGEPPAGGGPIHDVRKSVAFLRSLSGSAPAADAVATS